MESILTIDLENNPELLEDFDGVSAGDKVVVEACYLVSELSENRTNLPLVEVYSIKLKEEGDEDDEEEEDSDEEENSDEPETTEGY